VTNVQKNLQKKIIKTLKSVVIIVLNAVNQVLSVPYVLVFQKLFDCKIEINKNVRIYNLKKESVVLDFLNNETIIKKGKFSDLCFIFVDIYSLPLTLSDVAEKSIKIQNAGGRSQISEMYSIEYFSSIYGATNFIFEKEISYWISYKMVDFICTINGNKVGISVSRAMGFPTSDKFDYKSAERLLYKKLNGLIIARNGVKKEQSFYKSILHIWCENIKISKLIKKAFHNINESDYGISIKGILLIKLTICDDPKIYKNIY
jgi:hypothetical protein